MKTLLVIDDNEDFIAMMKTMCDMHDYKMAPLKEGTRAVEAIRKIHPDLVILDIIMPGVMGADVYRAIRNDIGPDLPIIIVSATRMKIKSAPDPLLDYCPKPVNVDDLVVKIEGLIRKYEMRKKMSTGGKKEEK